MDCVEEYCGEISEPVSISKLVAFLIGISKLVAFLIGISKLVAFLIKCHA
jgi:hypothetical protein